MFIETQETPNPQTLKFVPGVAVMVNGTASFRNQADAKPLSPLAFALFDIDGVEGVFLGDSFVAVTKHITKTWDTLKIQVLAAIVDHYAAGLPVYVLDDQVPVASASDTQPKTYAPETQAVVDQIIELLETRVRPAVAMDGGDIQFHDFKDGIVYLTMQGACSGCPSASVTLKSGIENLLRHYVPEVVEVRPWDEET
jgi:Fe-S cluster biogenesis protein NfuA